jgi:hypothetical protein
MNEDSHSYRRDLIFRKEQLNANIPLLESRLKMGNKKMQELQNQRDILTGKLKETESLFDVFPIENSIEKEILANQIHKMASKIAQINIQVRHMMPKLQWYLPFDLAMAKAELEIVEKFLDEDAKTAS